MLNKNEKLVMVSVVYKGKRAVRFVKGHLHYDGRVTVARSVIDSMLDGLCPKSHRTGVTYSVGA